MSIVLKVFKRLSVSSDVVNMRTVNGLLFASLLLLACSNRQVYETMQNRHQLECQKLPQVQYEECIKQLQSYDEYQRRRQQAEEGVP